MGIFIIFSGILGPRIISHGLVNKDGFEVYGGAGKSLLFAVIALGVLLQRKGLIIKLPKWSKLNTLWLGVSILCLLVAYIGVSQLIHQTQSNWWLVLVHVGLLASILTALIGSYGLNSLTFIGTKYRRELLITAGLAVAFDGFLYLVYDLWRVLAVSVLHSVQWLLTLIGLHSVLLPPRTLLFNKFGINIAETCSGIESIALFTALYGLVGVLDWTKLNKNRYYGIFLPALLLLFAFNILRVAGLILAGYYINPTIAFSLFHTYAGMVFFIIYSALFWGTCYRLMLLKRADNELHKEELA